MCLIDCWMKKWTWKACGKHSYIDSTGPLSVMNLLVGYANAKAKETLRQGDDRLPRFGVQLARIRIRKRSSDHVRQETGSDSELTQA